MTDSTMTQAIVLLTRMSQDSLRIALDVLVRVLALREEPMTERACDGE